MYRWLFVVETASNFRIIRNFLFSWTYVVGFFFYLDFRGQLFLFTVII